jgi:hypothetical protein
MSPYEALLAERLEYSEAGRHDLNPSQRVASELVATAPESELIDVEDFD